MSPNEIQTLCVGFTLGAEFMAGLHVYWNWRDRQREERTVRRQLRILGADRYLDSLHRYQRQQRSQV